MIREERIYRDSKTGCCEVFLDHTVGGWIVSQAGENQMAQEYPDTDKGYREARLDYGRRITRRVWGDETPPGVYFGFENVTPETVDFLVENAGNCEEVIGARIDTPRARSLARYLEHWIEHRTLPTDKTAEEWLLLRAFPGGRNKARDAAKRLFGALQAEWADRPDTHPLLEELAAEHPWIREGA